MKVLLRVSATNNLAATTPVDLPQVDWLVLHLLLLLLAYLYIIVLLWDFGDVISHIYY